MVLYCHQNADPDAVCSALALQALLKILVPEVRAEVSCPGGVSTSTKQLLENLGFSPPIEKAPAMVDLAILVDTNTLDQLGKAREQIVSSNAEVVVVDHHHPHPDTLKAAALMIVDESAAAAAEVVFKLVTASKKSLERQEALALLAAIFVETRHFLLARKSTFQVAANLVESGADPRYLAEALTKPMNRSERMARLKAATRGQVTTVEDWIVAFSELGSYQSSAARAFLGLGAHVAFVGGEVKEGARVNMRAIEDFSRKTGVHLGRDVAIPLGKQLGGTGGGHSTAAGLSATSEVGEALKRCVERIKELIGQVQS